jgi:hypothetical protein
VINNELCHTVGWLATPWIVRVAKGKEGGKAAFGCREDLVAKRWQLAGIVNWQLGDAKKGGPQGAALGGLE